MFVKFLDFISMGLAEVFDLVESTGCPGWRGSDSVANLSCGIYAMVFEITMHIEELKGGEELSDAEAADGRRIVVSSAKRLLVGAGARALFYPTLLYNVLRNRFQGEFHWWDRIDEFILLGAVPFSADVKLLKELGVSAVITLNEPYETLVPASLYQAHGIDHLVLPTRDYCYAPSLTDICKAAVQEYYHFKVKRMPSSTSSCNPSHMTTWISRAPRFFAAADLFTFDDGSVVVVTKADLDGYESGQVSSEIWADLSVVYRVRVAGQATMARLSCLWLRCNTQQISSEGLHGESNCSIKADQVGMQADQTGGLSVDIHVY
ncbi:hypothetical protein RJ640_012904 [Escallonia rubra]|uniref:Dual specificity protein phosphatase DSP8 n=1 Tax=Escallonia rubra TaxID=112253 RepID=A0AA88R3R8_9ASTE|nr:hypothetical protein RJ640_012904 [Escallonia rubra]